MMRQLRITPIKTPRESRSLTKYLNEIAKVDLLSPEEETQLAKRVRKGDADALHKLVEANLRFVVSVAKQYPNSYLSLNDLINEGNLGLITAAERFDETKGFRFISYAIWWIRQSILKAIAEQSRLIRLPLNRVASLNKLNRASSALEQRFGREPSAEELSEEMDSDIREIDVTLRMAQKPVSVDAPFGEDNDMSYHDVLVEEGVYVKTNEAIPNTESLKIDTERILGTLTERQKDVIEMFYGLRSE